MENPTEIGIAISKAVLMSTPRIHRNSVIHIVNTIGHSIPVSTINHNATPAKHNEEPPL